MFLLIIIRIEALPVSTWTVNISKLVAQKSPSLRKLSVLCISNAHSKCCRRNSFMKIRMFGYLAILPAVCYLVQTPCVSGKFCVRNMLVACLPSVPNSSSPWGVPRQCHNRSANPHFLILACPRLGNVLWHCSWISEPEAAWTAFSWRSSGTEK